MRPSLSEWIEEKSLDTLAFSVRDWIRIYFTYCCRHHQSFYWEWNRFLVIVHAIRIGGRKKKAFSLELRGEFFLFSNPPETSLIPVLLLLLDEFPESYQNTRNAESSVHPFLSFHSFLDLIVTLDIPLPEVLSIARSLLHAPITTPSTHENLTNIMARLSHYRRRKTNAEQNASPVIPLSQLLASIH